MLNADELKYTMAEIDGKWVCAKPCIGPFKFRLHDAIEVLKGNAMAVKFVERSEER